MEDSEKNRYIEFLLQQKEERDRTIADELKTAHEEDARKMDKLISSINDLTAQLKLKNKPVR